MEMIKHNPEKAKKSGPTQAQAKEFIAKTPDYKKLPKAKLKKKV